MDAQAVEQARGRLQRADKALYALKTATRYEEAEEAWSDFLLAASTIYSKLEQGSKSKGSSAGWHGRKKKERKDDPLLSFLHHARNSDEHGIERVAERGGNIRDLGGKPLMFNEYREHVITDVRDGETGEIKLQNIKAILHGPSLVMIRVHDRGVSYDPPTTHMGKTIEVEDNSLIGVASLGFEYLTKLVAEAETLI
ncbi:hypothetical protein [Bradyrhizobium sp. LA2.1]|uniref:hypothetical protein n=1 Tax=Bradyrhizobium sp. LA2.1 TaxID=3156376 RepID=UPI00339491FC